MSEKKYSIVIPTLWRCVERTKKMLDIYERSEYVGEVIIIDNNPANAPELSYSKVKIITKGKNIYVNPAWNLGAKNAKYDIILANDDIDIERFDEVVEMVSQSDYDIVGACNCAIDTSISITPVHRMELTAPHNPTWSFGFGSLMFIRNYKEIPDSIKIYYGDDYLFFNAKKRGYFYGAKFTNPSITAERTKEWDTIKANDAKEYSKWLDKNIRLSVSMIVKNESSCLEKCLESVKDADEIVIVDTGSTDNTVEIAKRYTDKVFFGDEYLWRDDFSFSRNQALERCTGDWVLSIDADEVLEKGGIAKIRTLLSKRHKEKTFMVKMQSGSNEHYLWRIFRNNTDIRWVGRGHELISPFEHSVCDIKITYGSSEAHKLDPDRMLRILTKAVDDNPQSSRDIYYLAREYWYRRDYKTAAMWYEKYTKIGTWKPELADGWLYLARCYWQLQRGDEARDAVTMAVRINPDFKEALLFMAETHYDPMKSHWLKYAKIATNNDVLFIRT